MQKLQEEISADLLQIKQAIDFSVPDYIRSIIAENNLEGISQTKKRDLIKALTGSRTVNEENFSTKLTNSLIRHLLRVRHSRMMTIPGLNSNSPKYLGQMINLTLFIYEDLLLEQNPILMDITKKINQKIYKYYEEITEQLRAIKEKEHKLLKMMQMSTVSKQPLSINYSVMQQDNFDNCVCKIQAGLYQQVKQKISQSRVFCCKMCGFGFHAFCLQIACDIPVFICPQCTIHNLEPLNRVVGELLKPQYIQYTLFKNERTLYFQIPAKFKDFNISIRCLRIDGKGGIDDMTWPDYGEIYVNSYNVKQFLPLPVNYSVKKRKDESVNINTQKLIFDAQNKVTLFESKPNEEMKKSCRINLGSIYLFGIFATNQLTVKEFIMDIVMNPKNNISIYESKAMTKLQDKEMCYTNKINLQCQMTMELMNTPAKGKFCDHLQCFDLANFVNLMQSQSQKWRCVICKAKCYQFVVDNYQQKIIEIIKENQLEIKEVEFNQYGDIMNEQLAKLCQNKLPNSDFQIQDLISSPMPKKIVKK